MEKMTVLALSNVSKRFGPTVALDSVSFRVEDAEIFGLLGPNGAGKTTLLSILSCLLAATDGEAWLLGKRLDPTDRDVRRQIGLVPQELALYGELTARENLRFFGELYGLNGAELEQRVIPFLTLTAREEVK